MTRLNGHQRPLRIGVVGCGAVAGYGHLPAIARSEAWRLHALLDPDPDRLAAAAEPYGLPREALCTNAAAFYERGLDAVTLTSPAPAHRQNALDAIRRGVPILCEKPLAMSADEGREMAQAAEDGGVMLAVGFCYRYSEAAQLIKRLVDDGAIGRLRTLRLVFNWSCHGAAEGGEEEPAYDDKRRRAAERREGRMLEGGPMVDCGTHQIDLAHWWTGSRVSRVTGHGSWADRYEAPDHVWAHLDHDNGAHTMVEMSFSYGHNTPHLPKRFEYELIGTDGVISYQRDTKTFTLHDRYGERTLPFSPEKGFAGMYAAFAEAVRDGRLNADLVGARDAIEITRIARQATDDALRFRALRTTPDAPTLAR